METVRNLDSSTVDGLQSLCKLCHDSAEGFRTTAEHFDRSDLTEAFVGIADDRQAARDQIAQMLGTSHENIPDGGTALGSIHRWWLDTRSSLNGGNTDVVLAEAIRGEETIEGKYEDVLKETAGSPANAMLQEQIAGIKACRKALEDLREALD